MSFLINCCHLKSLSLGSGLTSEGALCLAQSKNMRELVSLKLDGNQIGDIGAQALASSENFENLERLSVFSNGLNEDSRELLLTLPKIVQLNGC